ncbi:hypothetical protein GTP81_16105 [Rugamonas sp. FT107W]|uniref:Uncharacterized protein n=1 Tax=Duganella vulcania TaxID=2692166 RepID=A0A845HL65_9BURK|nr:hypothetical protein [Duganella vulcania]MYN18275.1 hypothetical protein [Duganella vulcania]
MPELKTVEDFKQYLDSGGVGAVEGRMEKAFALRLANLKGKISRLELVSGQDVELANILIDSILVDCRALFLEDDKRKRNSTLQNIYLARRMPEKAQAVDEVFDMEIVPGKKARKIIKAWVDRRVVHMDWLWGDEEVAYLENIRRIIFSGGIDETFKCLKTLIEEYERFTAQFGKDSREQIDLVLTWLTGDAEN